MERLSTLDAAILELETPTQQLNVLAIMVIDPDPNVDPVDYYKIFRERIASRLPLIPQLRKRLRSLPGLAYPVWEDDPDLAIDAHLHHLFLDPAGDLHALGVAAGEIASRPLHRDRPMWEVWLIEGLDNGAHAVVAKVHHSLIDGTSGFGALAAFFDLEPHAPPVVVPPFPRAVTTSFPERARESINGGVRWTKDFVTAIPRVARIGWHGLRRVRNPDVALPLQAPRLAMNRALTQHRTVEFTTVQLSQLKALRRAFDVTLNDLLVAVVAGALRAYLRDRNELPNRALVAGVPTSERTLEDGHGGNKFSTMFYAVPVHIDDPVERVAATARSAAGAKELYEAAGRQSMISVASLAPPGMLRPVMQLMSGVRAADHVPPIANLMISNVRGPDFPLYVSGGRVTHMFPMGPLIEGTGLNITLVSYLDSVGFGFQACPELVPDVERLVDAVHEAVAELDKAAAKL